MFSYLCSPRSLLCSPRSLLCSTKNLNFPEVCYVLLEVYCVLLEVYYVLLKVYCVLLEVYCVLLEVYYVLLKVYYVLLEVYCVLLEVYYVLLKCLLRLRRTLYDIQNLQVYLCSTQENTLRLSEICKPTCVLLRRTLYDSLKLTSLLVFYSGEHFTTIQYLRVYLCYTQENTLQLPKIDMSTCVLLRRTLYNYPISASLFVFSLRRTLYNYPISASLLVFYYSYFAFQLVRLVRWFRG